MPTVEGIAARIERDGEIVTFTAVDGDVSVPGQVPAFVRGYRAAELVNDIQQGDREVTIAPGALLAVGVPRWPERLDRLEIGGSRATVQSCETRSLRGVPAMHVIQVRGG